LIKPFFTLGRYFTPRRNEILKVFHMSQEIRWARNAQLAKYAGVSTMTLWRWKQMPDFPPSAVINNTEYNDLDAFDRWMSSFIARRDAEPTRGQRAVMNLRREAGGAA
jgi:hypothetical protein